MASMPKNHIAAACALLLTCSPAIHAETEAQLNAVTVTGERGTGYVAKSAMIAGPGGTQEVELKDLPASVSVITRDLLDDKQVKVMSEAVRLDAACLCVNLIQLPNNPEIREANIKSIMALRKEATRYNMPLMIEPLVMQDNSKAGGYMVDGDTKKVVTLVRQAIELGADIIKAYPTDDISDYHKVIEVAGDIPVLVRGGGRVDDKTLLERTVAVLDAGAK